MDDIDRKIIAILSEDGRLGNNSIARQLGISEGTVRNRIRKLTESGVLRVAGRVNPEAVPNRQFFLLGLKVAASKDLNAVADALMAEPDVQAVYITTGRYDLVTELWLPVKHGLVDFINGPVTRIDGIVSTESFLAMQTFGKWVDPASD